MLNESEINSTMPQFSLVDRISYGVSFNFSFLFLKIRSMVSMSYMANCSERRSSPLLMITRRSFQVLKWPYAEAYLTLCSWTSEDSYFKSWASSSFKLFSYAGIWLDCSFWGSSPLSLAVWTVCCPYPYPWACELAPTEVLCSLLRFWLRLRNVCAPNSL